MAMSELAGASRSPLRARVAAEVRAWRARRSMTQVQLARALGMSQAQMSARLRGEVPITLDEIERLADIFGCTPADLMTPALGESGVAASPPYGIRVTSAQSCPPTETITDGDELAGRRKRRRDRDARPLPRPVIGEWPRHLHLVGISA